MLNYNKIDSAINYQRTPKTVIAQYLGIPESTLRSRMDKKNLTPDDVEKLANFFNKPMTYFFDNESEKDISNEPEVKYFNCPECITKQKEIDRLSEELKDKKELLEFYRGKKESHDESGASGSEDTKRNKAV